MRDLLRHMQPAGVRTSSPLSRCTGDGHERTQHYADHRKNSRQAIKLFTRNSEEPLRGYRRTYGLIVLSEQIMRIAQKLSYSLARRRLYAGHGQKKREVLEKGSGCSHWHAGQRVLSGGHQALWDTILPFADYAFDKLHMPAGYGRVSWTATSGQLSASTWPESVDVGRRR